MKLKLKKRTELGNMYNLYFILFLKFREKIISNLIFPHRISEFFNFLEIYTNLRL